MSGNAITSPGSTRASGPTSTPPSGSCANTPSLWKTRRCCRMARFRIHTNWTNSVSKIYEFTLDDLADAAIREQLKWAMADPERLRPEDTRQALTERAATTFAALAHTLRERGYDPQEVAHFVNRLVFCMFAEDVGLLPDKMFTQMLNEAHQRPEKSATMARALFGAMATGGLVGFKSVAWFNGGLFDDDLALPLEKSEIETTLAAADLDWSEIDPSILGTLFERGSIRTNARSWACITPSGTRLC